MSARSKFLCSTAEACRRSPCTWAGRMPNNMVRWAHQMKPAVSCMTVSPRVHLEPCFSPARSSCAVLGLLAEPRKLTCTPRTSSTLAGRTWQLQELTRPLVYNVKRPRNRHVDERAPPVRRQRVEASFCSVPASLVHPLRGEDGRGPGTRRWPIRPCTDFWCISLHYAQPPN